MANGVDRKPPPSLPPHRPSRAVACLPACLPGRLPDCLVATHNPTPSLASCDANKFEEEQQLLGLPRWGKRLKLWEQHDQQQGHFPVGGQPARRPGFQFGSEAPPQQSSPSSAPPSCLSRSSHPSLNPHPNFNGKADNDTLFLVPRPQVHVLIDADGVSRWATSGVHPLASQTAAVAIAITFKFRPEDAAAAAAAPRVINEVDAPEQVHESPPPDASVSVERSGGRA
ncbi:hypothetical protein ACCO45_011145 [Purpureocillium lilacinum]|uniref:Uncharacterized protein n=1 Tax=Purpureocillium lilacinum TaxID=33203 RepID=A0ACC4DGT8_PURLI